jgi:DNA-binding transcriptional MerR regulator
MNRLLQRLEEGKLYYSISEVCRMTGLEAHVLRYWETEFAQMRPRKNRAGNRAYRTREIEYIRYIQHLLHEEKYTLQGAKKKLAEVSYEEVVGQTTLLKVAPVVQTDTTPKSTAAVPVADALARKVEASAAPVDAAGLTELQRKELSDIREGLKDVLKKLSG